MSDKGFEAFWHLLGEDEPEYVPVLAESDGSVSPQEVEAREAIWRALVGPDSAQPLARKAQVGALSRTRKAKRRAKQSASPPPASSPVTPVPRTGKYDDLASKLVEGRHVDIRALSRKPRAPWYVSVTTDVGRRMLPSGRGSRGHSRILAQGVWDATQDAVIAALVNPCPSCKVPSGCACVTRNHTPASVPHSRRKLEGDLWPYLWPGRK